MCLFFGLLTLPTIWLSLGRLGQQHSDKLGHILTEQLADQARQPILYRDKISLQVLVNGIVSNNDDVVRAAILDVDSVLQVRSDNEQNDSRWRGDVRGSIYRHQIELEGSSAGLAELRIDSTNIKRDLRGLFWIVALVWILLSALLCFGLKHIGGNLARRLTRIVGRLPTCLDCENANEIDRLENSIKPLLVKPEISYELPPDPGSLTLTICCENIRGLKAQLSQQSYQRLLQSFDVATNCAIKLFDGTRSPGLQHCIHLNFSCDGDRDSALLRAISCYLAITDMLRNNALKFGSGLTLRATIALTGASSEHTQFERDQQRETELQQLVKTTALAGSWQLLIQAALIQEGTGNTGGKSEMEESTAPKTPPRQAFSYEAFGCQESDSHVSQETDREFNPAANSALKQGMSPETESAIDNLVLFKTLNPEYQDILAGQLAYLRSQLPSLVAAS